MPPPTGDGVGSYGESAQQQNLREFLEAIEACNAVLSARATDAVNVDIAAEEAVQRADTVLQAIEDALKQDWDSLVTTMQETGPLLEAATTAANTMAETELPDAIKRLEEVPSLLDAAVDPARAELVSGFENLKDHAFAAMAGHVQQAGTSIEAADDGSSPLQPFLELPGELQVQAESHDEEQQREAGEIDARTTALSGANDATHTAAEAGARTWGETCTNALEGICETQADAVRDVYTGWEQATEAQQGELDQAIEAVGTRLSGALDAEDANVDRETAEAQTSLDQLHDQMKKANDEMDQGESLFMTLAEMALPELAIARRMVDKFKDLAEAVGS